MERLTGRFGETDFSGSIGLDLQAKPDLDIRITSKFLDLTPLTDAVGGSAAIAIDSKSIPEGRTAAGIAGSRECARRHTVDEDELLRPDYDNLHLQGTFVERPTDGRPAGVGSSDGNLNARFAIGTDLTKPNVRLVADGDQIRLAVIPGVNSTAAASLYKVQIDVAATAATCASWRQRSTAASGSKARVGACRTHV